MKTLKIIVSVLLALSLLSLWPTSAAHLQRSSQKPLTNANIVYMVKGGLTDGTIVKLVQTRPNQFDVSPNALVNLKASGVSSQVIDAMVSASDPSSAAASSSQRSPARSPAPPPDQSNNTPATVPAATPLAGALESPGSASPAPNPRPLRPSAQSSPQAASPTSSGGSSLADALSTTPHSSPQEVLAGNYLAVSTVDTIDLAGVSAGRTFRAESTAPLRRGTSEVLPAGAGVYLKVVKEEPKNDWIVLDVTIDRIDYQGSPVKMSSSIQRLRVRASAESMVRDRVVKWPAQQVQVMPKTRLSFRVQPPVQ